MPDPPIVIHPDNELVTDADLRERLPGVELIVPPSAGVAEYLASTDGPLAFLCANREWEAAYGEGLDTGDLVSTIGAGYDSYPIEAFRDRGITFTNASGIQDQPAGEHVFGMAFCFSRRLLTYRDHQRDHEWMKWGVQLPDYGGDVCCVVGLGSIGEAVAERAQVFGMDVRGVKRTVEGYAGAADEVYPAEDLLAALDGARLVVLCVPLTDETRGLIGAEALAACDDDAIVLNVARGPVLDTEALLAALDNGEIGGAGLDVFDTEPLPHDSPLWDRDDVLITPHRLVWSEKYTDRFADLYARQYRAWAAGEAPPGRVV